MSNALVDSNIMNDELFSINNVLKPYDDMKEEIKKLKLKQSVKDFRLFIKQCYLIVLNVEQIKKLKYQRLKR